VGRAELLDAMPPWHGGGEMILIVAYERSTFKKALHKFEAGTPNIAGVIGLGAAIEYLERTGRERIAGHDRALTGYALERLTEIKGLRVLGPGNSRGGKHHAGLVSFVMDCAHAHDVMTFADQDGIALRGGHHYTQPLLRKLGLASTARASFYFYNTRAEIDRLIETLEKTRNFFA
jgi:cysteine desulfurase/selenocysteine lyase